MSILRLMAGRLYPGPSFPASPRGALPQPKGGRARSGADSPRREADGTNRGVARPPREAEHPRREAGSPDPGPGGAPPRLARATASTLSPIRPYTRMPRDAHSKIDPKRRLLFDN